MLGLGIIIGACLVGAVWAIWGWKEQPDKHTLYIREWKRSQRAWWAPKRARHRKTIPLLVRTRTVRRESAPLPLDWRR